MQVKLGPLVTDAAGSIGGTTFQRSFIGSMVRAKPLPTLRRGRYTNPVRGTLGQWAQTWKSLTAAQRLGWQNEADTLVWVNKFGDVIRGLGYWLYVRCNQNLARAGIAPIAAAGAHPAFTAVTGFTAAGAVATTISLTWAAPTPIPASTAWLVFATAPQSAGRSAAYGTYRLITVLNSGTATGATVGTQYNAKFGGNQVAGQRTFFRVQVVDTRFGHTGPVVEANFVWT